MKIDIEIALKLTKAELLVYFLILKNKEMAVCEIKRALGHPLSSGSVSMSLKTLKHLGLVKYKQSGHFKIYHAIK